MLKEYRYFAPLFLVAIVAGCSGGRDYAALPAAAVPGGAIPLSSINGKTSTKSYARLTIVIPSVGADSRTHRRRHYVSPATQSAVVAVRSAVGPVKSFAADLTPSRNAKCKAATAGVKCVLMLGLAPGTYTAAVSTYDGPLVNKEPTGSELSANQDVPFKVRAKKISPISVALGGVPVSAAFIPAATSQLSGSVNTGYTLPRCQATAQPVSVFGVDADGNFILGAGAPSVSMRSGSRSLAVVSPRPAAPNLFTLKPLGSPSYPAGGSTVYVQAQANPTAASGAKPVFAIVKITFSADICGVFTEFPVPTASSGPYGITAGPDGAMWFTEVFGDKIGRISTEATASNPELTEFQVPTPHAGPNHVALGADGALWFTECFAGQIGRIATSGSQILEFPTPTTASKPWGIVAGPDNAMWFTESAGNKIGRVPTSGIFSMREYSIPTGSSSPSGIAVGSDGAMWFVETAGNNIGRVTTAGAITESPVGTPNAAPRSIASGADGKLWFTECLGTIIGNIPISGSPVQQFTTPTLSNQHGITAGPDGALWFTATNANTIDRITTNGVITTYNVPTPGSLPMFIEVGPDGNLWFTEFGSDKIGRLQ